MEVSRSVSDNVKLAMTGCYNQAASESGPGMDVRQKTVVRDFVFSRGPTLFKSVACILETELSELLSDLHQAALDVIKSAIATLARGLRHHTASQEEKVLVREFKASVFTAVVEATVAAQHRKLTRQALLESMEHAQGLRVNGSKEAHLEEKVEQESSESGSDSEEDLKIQAQVNDQPDGSEEDESRLFGDSASDDEQDESKLFGHSESEDEGSEVEKDEFAAWEGAEDAISQLMSQASGGA